MNSTSVYVIAFGLGLVIAASLVFSAASNAVVGWALAGLFWLLVFLGVVALLMRLAPKEPDTEAESLPPHPLIADVVDPKKHRRRHR